LKHRFFETTEEKRVDFFFPPQNAQHEFSSHDLSFEKRKRDEKRKIFDEGSFQKVKKLVFCGCLQTEEGKTYTKTTQNRRKREKEKRNEKLCVFNVGVGLA
jgi:hypothetical protein